MGVARYFFHGTHNQGQRCFIQQSGRQGVILAGSCPNTCRRCLKSCRWTPDSWVDWSTRAEYLPNKLDKINANQIVLRPLAQRL